MEERINIAEILKNCPKGMELDCVMFDKVTLERVDSDMNYPIKIRIGKKQINCLTAYGKWVSNDLFPEAKCVIFPKGKTTWDGFVPPCKFKDGDIIYNSGIEVVAIFHKQTYDSAITHCSANTLGKFRDCHYYSKNLSNWRLATEEEKQKLFDAIRANGFKWNEETKTLEKLVDTKFDINTLKPFDKILVRCNSYESWRIDFFDCYDKKVFYATGGRAYAYCIPYKGNAYLRGKREDCSEYYKTWEV